MPPLRSFDRIARAYRWLEYLCFGRALERCRVTWLDEMAQAEQALVLGDGDGRFTAALLAAHRKVRVVAIDRSVIMLTLLSARVEFIGELKRLTTIAGDVRYALAPAAADQNQRQKSRSSVFPEEGYDLVCSHFFLDCLSTTEVQCLLEDLCPRLSAGARWIVSEFSTPTPWARLIVWLLYLGFAALTSLEAKHLPEWRAVFVSAGFDCVEEKQTLAGLLSSSVWQWKGPSCQPSSQVSARSGEATVTWSPTSHHA